MSNKMLEMVRGGIWPKLLFQREFTQIDLILWRRDEVDQLSDFSLEGGLQEKFQKVHIARFVPKVYF